MDVLYTITLITNGLTLALSLVMLMLVLWQDPRSILNQLFAVFLLTVVVWAAGSILARGATFIGADPALIAWGLRLLEAGFAGAMVALYLFVAVLTDMRNRLFYIISAVGIVFFVVYQVVIFAIRMYEPVQVSAQAVLRYEFGPGSLSFYLLFALATVFMALRHRRKIRERLLVGGVLMFVFGQLLDLLSPDLRATGLAVTVSAPAAMVMSFAIVRQRVMSPLAQRAWQLEAVRAVGLTIIRSLDLNAVLVALARQAAGLVAGDGAAIFLQRAGRLALAAVHNLPEVFIGGELAVGEGVAGRVAERRRSMNIEDYGNWKGRPDMPLAVETFGPLVAVPLVYGDAVVGVLEVIQGQMGRGFNDEDVRLLELLAPQAAVAIANGRLFEQQRALADELVAAKNQLETVLASTENPVVAVDRRLKILLANPAAREAFLPNPAAPVAGRHVTEVAAPGLLPSHPKKALRDLRRDRVHVYELSHQGRFYQCHLATLGRANPDGWVALFTDVTQLKELDQMKSDMVRIASHDLKNPLFGAMSHLELLREEGEESFNDDMREYMDVIEKQLERMEQIISGILDLERLQSGAALYETCSLSRIVREAAGELQEQALTKNLAFSVDWPTGFFNVLGDSQQLRRVFVNLIENAIKFTPAGGRVMVRLYQDDRNVVVEVSDTGIGIPPEAKEHLFKRFYRAAGAEHIKGSGLGLNLVKTIVDAHSGSVEFVSEVGVGSRFWVKLPVVRAAL
ncbi:MAG: GAF domain-containing protein [Anaerolineae bacterium]|nr:GAF domain-containing protein [Anaerolineae bacterium]